MRFASGILSVRKFPFLEVPPKMRFEKFRPLCSGQQFVGGNGAAPNSGEVSSLRDLLAG